MYKYSAYILLNLDDFTYQSELQFLIVPNSRSNFIYL